MGKTQTPRRILAAFLAVLYLWTPYLNVLTPEVFADQSSTSDSSTGDIPLPPGTVTNLGTCSPSATSNLPPISQTEWSLTLSIPKLLFMGTKSGSNITNYYLVSDNGTFSVRDDAGNSYSITPLKGFPPGLTSITLKANRTTAFQNWLVQAGPHVLANVTVVYSIRHQFCEPAGLKLTIKGTVDWGQSQAGRIVVPFDHKPLSVKPRRAWFGNQSGEALGFDWGDSLKQGPQFDSSAFTLSYPVNGTFSIDPVTISATTAQLATDFGYQHPICYAASRFWLFYYDGSNYGFRSSTDGVVWSAETVLATNGTSYGELWSTACSSTEVFYETQSGTTVYYRYGTLNTDGSITWAIPESSMTPAAPYPNAGGGSSVAIDSKGDLWLALSTTCYPGCGAPPNYYLEVWECATPSNCSWSSAGWPTPSSNASQYWPDIVSIGNAQVAVVYATPNVSPTTGEIVAMAYQGGGSWTTPSQSGEACTSAGCGMDPNFGMGIATMGSTVEIATAAYGSPNGNNPAFLTYTAAGGLSPVSNPDGTSNNDCQSGCSISSDGSSNLVLWMASAGSIAYMTSSNSGSTWSAKTTVEVNTIDQDSRITAGYGNGHYVVAYQTDSSSPTT